MPELFVYLIKVNIALLVFCLGYYLVLRRLTFYTLNRVYLVTAIVFSTVYPQMDLTGWFSRHEQISRPVQMIVVNWQGQVDNLAETATQHDKWFWLQCIFWLGVVLFALRLAVQLVSLYKLHRRSQPAQVHKYIVRTISGNINPFSFWRNIYLNPENHTNTELRAILEHEQIHVNEWHTIDILLGEISTVFYWFNPGIWLMKRAIRENIEFITDRKILQKGMDSKAYQYSLLNVNFGAQHNTIVNNFNISTIKKRIIMMNAKRSSRLNITRYVVLVPVVVLFLSAFTVKTQLVKAAKNSAKVISTTFKTAVAKIDVLDIPAVVQRNRTAELLGDASFSKALNDTTKKPAKLKVMILNEPVEIVDLKNDTSKKFSIKLKHFADDNARIYIDGKEVDKNGMNALSPNSIEQINVFRTANNKENDRQNEGFIFITTKGNEANAKKNEEVIAQLRRENKIATDTIKRLPGQRYNMVYVTGVQTPASSTDPKLQTSVRIIKRDAKSTDSTVTITGNGRFTIRGNINGEYVNRDSALKDVVVVGYGVKARQKNPSVVSENTSFNNLENILKIVDGKEVDMPQFKKLSGADIKSIKLIKGEEAVRLYGEKAKNGVIIMDSKK